MHPPRSISSRYMYQHEPLDLERPAIRLIRLRGGNHNAIQCEVFQAFLDERETVLPYEALSDTWGKIDLNCTIEVNGKLLAITANLHLALKHLRYESEDRIIWVDGICINQSDAKERGHQVQQMSFIYRHAHRVLFWLGEATPATDVFLRSLKDFTTLAESRGCHNWKLDITTRALAAMPMLLGVEPDGHTQAVLDIIPGPSRKDTWWADQQDLYSLLRKFRGSKSSVERDIIFALRGLSTDIESTSELIADYETCDKDFLEKVLFALYQCDIKSDKTRATNLMELKELSMALNEVALRKLLLEGSTKKRIAIVARRGGFALGKETVSAVLQSPSHLESEALLVHAMQVSNGGFDLSEDGLVRAAAHLSPEVLATVLACKGAATIFGHGSFQYNRSHDRQSVERICGLFLPCAASNQEFGLEMVNLLSPLTEQTLSPQERLITVRDAALVAMLRRKPNFDMVSMLGRWHGHTLRDAMPDIVDCMSGVSGKPWIYGTFMDSFMIGKSFASKVVISFVARLLHDQVIGDISTSALIRLRYAEDGLGRTILSHAAEWNALGLAQKLLSSGSYADRVDKSGRTPLSRASQRGNEEMIQLLTPEGAEQHTRL
ncbi:Heterokaryon incompatibility protein 6, OR allele [Colletotrichum spinosum]|uniref:Heterokaryon incompatibility protein 6, OR allele n=1 Tax=Colletotrichum spinosum TaxID=1347390 RepID=A0A4R8PS11_9PEZI|nr:Heterokaryon incompatibility protein 6, OR allele [Colletotrichum spinosum]